MADELDIEALLEEPYRREEENSVREKSSRERDRDYKHDRRRSEDRDRRRSSRSRDRERSSKRSRDRSRERSSKRSRDRSRDRSRSYRERSRSHERSRDRDRSRSRDRRRSRSRDRSRRYHRTRSISPIREPSVELTPEERDARTIFCMQLAARIRPRDLEDFFSAIGKMKTSGASLPCNQVILLERSDVGYAWKRGESIVSVKVKIRGDFVQVKDVKLILDNKSHRSKGIAYVEFKEVESVALAIGLSGQRLLGVPIIVQPSHAERNRLASAQAAAMKSTNTGPMRLYVGSLHYNITEEMLQGIFEPFGQIEDLKLMKDHQTGRSAGYGFITYKSAEDAKKAMDQLNGFELAGRLMKIGNVTEKTGEEGNNMFDVDEMDRYGFGMSATSRIQLMAKLAEGTGMQIPAAAANVLNAPPAFAAAPTGLVPMPPIATQCFMLSNMFDPTQEKVANWETELTDDIIQECNKHGGILHIYVDRGSPQGNVYIKCPSLASAAASVNALHGRYFDGKQITAAYVPLPNYHALFPDSIRAVQFVMPSNATKSSMTYSMAL